MTTAWQSALRNVVQRLKPECSQPVVVQKEIDWARLVTLDFETYFDQDYTLSKLSTSEYVRDPRFKAQMMYLKVGTKSAKIVPAAKIRGELSKINWLTHGLLCHHTQFDGLILKEHYGITPSFYFDTLSMARGLHSNEIGAGLEEVSVFYGGTGKVKDVLEKTKGVLNWSPALFKEVSTYCMQDGDETLRIFKEMVRRMPCQEMDLIDRIVRMFCDPVLRLDVPRVEAELQRELDRRRQLFDTVIDVAAYEPEIKEILKTKAERALPEPERKQLIVKRVIGSNERFADLLRAEDVVPPRKLSPAWMKKPSAERTEDGKWTYAFAKDDQAFIQLPERVVEQGARDTRALKAALAKQQRLQLLVDARLAVKSTSNITRAQRFLDAVKGGRRLPAYYAYSAAHTHRLGGGDKRNMQNLTRGGELRRSILAPPGHLLCAGDSGQIEARVNAMLWGQIDLLEGFRAKDAGTGADVYCTFATKIYGRTITKDDAVERHVGKTCVLGLGFQMGAAKLQLTLAKGVGGFQPVYLTLKACEDIVYKYRDTYSKIASGWKICSRIIEDMAAGIPGSHGPISWTKETIWLPNGLALKYPDLKSSVNPDTGWEEWTYKSGDIRKKLYGGLLCENIVQALARIVVMDQLLELSKSMRIVMTTHDEIVAAVKKALAERAKALMLKTMSTPPKWWPTLPVAAEVVCAENYAK